jgi:hypothetical protein
MAQKERVAEDDVMEESPFVLIDKLQEHGINASDISKLKIAGCYTIENLVFRTKKVIYFDLIMYFSLTFSFPRIYVQSKVFLKQNVRKLSKLQENCRLLV